MGPGAWRHGLAYGAMGLPLAFVALPLYVFLPNHYATEYGVPLVALGLVLLASRLFDAAVDPWIGRHCDRWFGHSPQRVWRMAGLAAVVLALGLWALFFPLPGLRALGGVKYPWAWLWWIGLGLALTSTAYSVIAVAHQAWGARLGGSEAQRSRVVAWREGLALAGVLLAAALPRTAGLPVTWAVFVAALVLGWWAWGRALRPLAAPPAWAPPVDRSPLRQPAFSGLLAVFVVNGTASAVPATLVLFFVQDRLQAPKALEPAFLGLYFLLAALSIPLWVRAVTRLGLAQAWLWGMGLSVLVFAWTLTLGTGDVGWFLLVCALSGAALGADLALPSALLAGVVGQLGERGRGEGAYFGWWSFATKFNLALAAGLSLPLLAWLGYAPGARDEDALWRLSLAYCLVPCLLKLLAAALLWRWMGRQPAPTLAPV